jgi:hypothetical protein
MPKLQKAGHAAKRSIFQLQHPIRVSAPIMSVSCGNGRRISLARSQHDFDFQPAGEKRIFVSSIYDFVLIFKVSMIIIPRTTAARRVLNKWKEHATQCFAAVLMRCVCERGAWESRCCCCCAKAMG